MALRTARLQDEPSGALVVHPGTGTPTGPSVMRIVGSRRLTDYPVEHAPEEYRESLLKNMRLHRVPVREARRRMAEEVANRRGWRPRE